jgi:hypothetical protein
VEGLGEDEVKSQAMASWSDRLRSPAWGERCRSVWQARPAHSLSDVVLYEVGPFAGRACRGHFFLIMEKVKSPPPTPARMGIVLCWLLVFSGGHQQCRWCGLGFRALPVGWSWDSSVAGRLVLGFERCRWVWRYFLVMGKVGSPPPTPARIGMVLYWILVDSGGPAVAYALAGRARAVPLVRSWVSSGAGRCGSLARRTRCPT